MRKTLLVACAAAMSVVGAAFAAESAQGFGFGEKALLRAMSAELQGKMKSAPQLGGKAITILPVKGDKEAYMEQQLVGAVVDAGLSAVVSNDDKGDERFRRILGEIRWDAVQTRLGSLDPKTIDELGSLKSTQVLVEARLTVACMPSKSGKRMSVAAELNLLAYEVATKEYVWSATAVAADGGGPEPTLAVLVGLSQERVPLEVQTAFKPADGASASVADRLDTLARGTLAELGYRLDTGRPADVVIAAEVSNALFDKSGSYLVFDGTVKANASVAGAEARLLGETTFDARGARGLGVPAACRNLADAMFEQLSPWMKRTLGPDAVGFEAVAFQVKFPGPVTGAADLAPVEAFKGAIKSMDGVRAFALAGQDVAQNAATFRVVYEKAKFPIGFVNALFTSHPELDKLLGD